MPALGKLIQGNSESQLANSFVGSVKVVAAAYLAFRYLPKVSTDPMMPCYAAAALSLGAPVTHLSSSTKKGHYWLAARGLTTLLAGLQLGALLHCGKLMTPANRLAAGLTLFAAQDLVVVKSMILHYSRKAASHQHPFHQLADEDIALVPGLVARGFDINAVSNKGATVLHHAAWNGQAAFVKELIKKHQLDVNATNNDGNTPLHDAAYSGQSKAFAALVENGADISAVSNKGATVLHHAAWNGQAAFIEELVEKYRLDVNATNDDGNTPLHHAAHSGQSKAFAALVENGADINNAVSDKGATVLHHAAYGGQAAFIEELVEKYRLDVNATNDDGNTPLHDAARNNRADAIKKLLRLGASTDATNNRKQTALQGARAKGYVEAIEALMAEAAAQNA
jgi:ankyrin repeat protein